MKKKYVTINKYKGVYEIRVYKSIDSIINDHEFEDLIIKGTLKDAEKYCKKNNMEVVTAWL